MNGVGANQTVVAVTPWWQTALYVLCGAMGVMTVVSVIMLIRAVKRGKTE